MDINKRALELLNYYGKSEFVSKLMDTDYKEIVKETGRGIFKRTTTSYELSPEFAKQIVIRGSLKFYFGLLKNYFPGKKVNIYTEKDADAIKVKIKDVRILKEAIDFTEKMYMGKCDTPANDYKAAKLVEKLREVITYESLGEYGVVYTHVISNVKPLTKQDETMLVTHKKLMNSFILNGEKTNESKSADEEVA